MEIKKLISIKGFLALLTLTVFLSMSSLAQEDPPRPMKVTTYQNLNFGAFINGYSGGTVSVDPEGNRSLYGDIIPVYLGYQYYPAIFEVEANAGSIISVLNGPDITLTGSNGGSLILHLGNCIPSSPFINPTRPPFRTQVRIGATLTVGSQLEDPAGNYTGTFFITFIQE